MLQKLRTRHDIDLPYAGFGRRRPTLAILGIIAVLSLFLPLVLALAGSLYRNGEAQVSAGQGIAAGVGTLILVMIIVTIIGKKGHDR